MSQGHGPIPQPELRAPGSAATAPPAGSWQPVDPSFYVTRYSPPLPDPAVVFSGMGYLTPRPRSSGAATAGLVFSLVGIPIVPLAPMGVILGAVGIHDTRGNRKIGRSNAIAATVIGAAVILFWAAILGAFWITSQ